MTIWRTNMHVFPLCTNSDSEMSFGFGSLNRLYLKKQNTCRVEGLPILNFRANASLTLGGLDKISFGVEECLCIFNIHTARSISGSIACCLFSIHTDTKDTGWFLQFRPKDSRSCLCKITCCTSPSPFDKPLSCD